MRTKTKSRWKPFVTLIGALLFGLALCGTYVFLADKFCAIELPTTPSPLQHLLGTAKFDGQHQVIQQHKEQKSWLGKFLCEAKAADVALVFFTYGLMVFTAYLAWATLKLWKAGEDQIALAGKNAESAAKSALAASDSVQIAKDFLERGYAFGGCGGRKLHTDQNGNPATMEVTASHGNYGKTPVFVEWVFVEQCQEKDLPIKPIYKNRIAVNDPLPPNGNWKLVNGAVKTFPAIDNQIFYGRFIYLDVFKKRHYSSFIYRFFRNGSHEPVSNADPEYWAWGEDNSPNG
jgi:hypothetical protein